MYSAPVSCGGFRDHGPLVILVSARLASIEGQSQHPHAWDRTLISRSMEVWRARSTSSTAGTPRDPLVDKAISFQPTLLTSWHTSSLTLLQQRLFMLSITLWLQRDCNTFPSLTECVVGNSLHCLPWPSSWSAHHKTQSR